ncbi:MAG TPA: group 1 truncated hemoglobin [Sphingomonas sp.]|nr:group 1 truncated hemoglobin [Sphingomonas sp.]
MFSLFLAAALALQTTPPGEDPVEPYTHSNANAGATPFTGKGMWKAFHGKAGVDRIVDDLVARNARDPRIADIFKGQDLVRLRRTLKEQFCYILGGGCDYTGRAMAATHKDMGLQQADFNALVENLQAAMRREHVPFFAQNAFLAKLAPMERVTVER